jgi:hypothetical protein
MYLTILNWGNKNRLKNIDFFFKSSFILRDLLPHNIFFKSLKIGGPARQGTVHPLRDAPDDCTKKEE